MLGIVTNTGRPGNGRPVADKPVYYAKDIKTWLKAKIFHEVTDWPAFLRKEFPQQFGGKNDQEIRKRVTDAISHQGKVCKDGFFVSYSNGGFVDVLEEETEKQTQKKRAKK